ncbi:TIGR02234 family membrane protein [Nocardioides ginkgobilobae]
MAEREAASEATRESSGRRFFGPAVLAGLASGTLAAVAGTRAAVSVDADSDAVALVTAGTTAGDALTMPLVTSLALVVLAAWGVVLVTRARVRRLAAGLALLASLGTLVAAAVAQGQLRGTVEDSLAQVGAAGGAGVTGWYVAALVGAVVMTASAGLAVRHVRDWPEMGQRYDAPASSSADATRTTDGSLDLWKAIDQGLDPTDGPSGRAP